MGSPCEHRRVATKRQKFGTKKRPVLVLVLGGRSASRRERREIARCKVRLAPASAPVAFRAGTVALCVPPTRHDSHVLARSSAMLSFPVATLCPRLNL